MSRKRRQWFLETRLMGNLYLVFFFIGVCLFLFIVLYSVYKKKQSDWHIDHDTSSYIDPSDTSGEYLEATPEQEQEKIEPSFRLDPTKEGSNKSKSAKPKPVKAYAEKKAPVFGAPKEEPSQVSGSFANESIEEAPKPSTSNLELEVRPVNTKRAKDRANIKPKLDPNSSTITTELVAKIKNPLPVEQQELLTSFRLHDFKFNRKVHLFGLNQLTENWRDIEFELPSARFVELGLSIQLADRDGAMTEKELHDFQQMVLDFTNKFDAPFEFSMPIDDAYDQGQALDIIGRRYDSMAVLNIVSKTQGGFRVADLGSCARDLMMSCDKKGIYLKTIGQKDNISILYRLAITDGAGNLLPPDAITAISHDLVMYMNVPATSEPQKVFQEMIKDANSLATWLEGKVVDRNRHNMTDHSYSVLMQQIVDITENMKKDGLSPGDAVSKLLF